MKKINLNLTTDDVSKKISVTGKIYFWEKVECIISGLDIDHISTMRAAIYDEDIQVVKAVNFADGGFNNAYCEFILQTEELQGALADTKPNARKNFTLYIWDDNQEEMVSVGTLPIYQNPYIENEEFQNVIVQSNIRIQYSANFGQTWSDECPESTTNVRFSSNSGKTWDGSILLLPEVASLDNNIATEDVRLKESKIVVIDEQGNRNNLTLEQLENLIGSSITIYED